MPGRSANGDPQPFKDAAGRWRVSVSLGDGKRKTLYGKTERECKSKLRRLQRDLEAGKRPVDTRLTLNEWMVQWLDTRRPPVIRPSSWEAYDDLRRLHVEPVIGKVRLTDLAPAHLTRVYRTLMDRGIPHTAASVHRLVKAALKQAMRQEMLARNVAEMVDPPRTQPAERIALTLTQARQLLASLADDPFAVLYLLAITTGMRQGELFALRWADVDLKRRVLHVTHTVRRVRGLGMHFGPPKTRSSERRIPLTDELVAALERQRLIVATTPQPGKVWRDHDLVFPNSQGGVQDDAHFARLHYRRMLERAGLPRIPFHALRHSAASILAELNVHPHVVASILGHADASLTMRIYTHTGMGSRASALELLENAFQTPTGVPTGVLLETRASQSAEPGDVLREKLPPDGPQREQV